MREIVVKLTGKLEKCFECLDDELAVRAITNILKHRAYIELRAGGRDYKAREEIRLSTLPETAYLKENKQEESKKMEELYAMVQGLSDAMKTGTRIETVGESKPVTIPGEETDLSSNLAKALSSVNVKQEKSEPKVIVVEEDEDVDFGEFDFLGI